ncbi:MAG: hypothetical protein N3D79_02035 [Acidilobaceae archaeon]|nr:hypothetical protein [Acidilobaceae archaeon]
MRYKRERAIAFVGSLMLISATFFALLGYVLASLLLWLGGMLTLALFVQRVVYYFERQDIAERMKEGTVLLAFSLLPAYVAGYFEHIRSEAELITWLHNTLYIIETASVPRLVALIMFHILSVISIIMISSALLDFSRLAGERSYVAAAVFLFLAAVLLSPLFAFLGVGAAFLNASVYGRIRVPLLILALLSSLLAG